MKNDALADKNGQSEHRHQSVDILLDDILRIKPGELVYVISDTNTLVSTRSLMDQIMLRKAVPVLGVYVGEEFRSGLEPPSCVSKAAEVADVAIAAATMSLANTSLRRILHDNGGRFFSCPSFSFDLLDTVLAGVDLEAVRSDGTAVSKLLEQGKQATVVSGENSEYTLELDISERRGNAQIALCGDAGSFASLSLEANVSPHEDKGDGAVEVSALHPTNRKGSEWRKSVLHFKDGKIVDIVGLPADTDFIEKVLKSYEDDQMYHFAELGVGLNPVTRFTGESYIADESARGTIHFGMGRSISLGGCKHAAGHVDFIVECPTVRIDHISLLREGHIIIPNAR